jgi:hypothetical protein
VLSLVGEVSVNFASDNLPMGSANRRSRQSRRHVNPHGGRRAGALMTRAGGEIID